MPLALQAKGVTKTYGGVKALTEVDIDVRAGEVLCLAGANGSGKSTLIKIISGVETADAGHIEMDGVDVGRPSVTDSIDLGIQVIYQDMSLFPNLTVAENIAMSARVKAGRKVVRVQDARATAERVVERLDLQLSLDEKVENISVADRQLVAICRALALDVKVLFMDEPTTALTWREIDSLSRVVEQLKADGVAIVFVSHKTEEVFMMSDRITVLRNGVVAKSGAASEFTPDSLIESLLGYLPSEERQLSALPADATTPALEVHDIGRHELFEGVSFEVGAGEIVGLTGLLGSGRSEIAEAIFGILPIDTGEIRVAGQAKPIGSVQAGIEAGIGYVPEDRLTQGVILEQSIESNLVAASLDKVSRRAGFLDSARMAHASQHAVETLGIKTDNPANPVSSLSGGNQQRVVLGKWMETEPSVLILNGPTVGVDAGSKAVILDILRRTAEQGTGILMISDDVPELVSVCHRVLFVRRGRMDGELEMDAVSPERIRERLDR
ncbi:sugar ABC transporter ATP-binding protein [Demequina sediminicola]|uniref:sugar ABC transporter ATP-binding protein n=1 Tax=Demequina sediminicola TaxID=1095026 RepID=UPI000785313E|nr:sugar ABC transporter ATP-binding protein [Demequina sediminicola]